jgi:hypothetical protein
MSLVESSERLTKNIFAKFEQVYGESLTHWGLPLYWSIFSTIHFRYSIGRLSGIPENKILRVLDRQWIADLKRLITFDLVLFPITAISFLYILCRRKKEYLVCIWSGDFWNEKSSGDFRLGPLFHQLDCDEIKYIEFIRDSRLSLYLTIKNLVRRRRPVIYYGFFSRLSRLIYKFAPVVEAGDIKPYDLRLFKFLRYYSTNKFEIGLIKWIFDRLQITHLIAWEFSERQAPLIFAAKVKGIPIFGFMHGAGMRCYMIHEFIKVNPKLSNPVLIDNYGVWSEWWREYYLENSNIYGKVEVVRPLKEGFSVRAHAAVKRRENRVEQRLKILWVCEPLIDPLDIINYLDLAVKNGEVLLKVRDESEPGFLAKLFRLRPEYRSLPVVKGDIYSAISLVDVVVGSHSTAVLDAALLDTALLLVNSQKWGNYFELDETVFCQDTDEFVKKIQDLPVQDLHLLRQRFFGSSERHCASWLVGLIKRKDECLS